MGSSTTIPVVAVVVVVLLLTISLSACHGQAQQQQQLTDEDVLGMIQQVFPPSDGSSLVGQGERGVRQVRRILQKVVTTGCPAFVSTAQWPHSKQMFKACVWAILGKLANDEVTSGGAFAAFALDTRGGVIVRATQAEETTQSLMILSALIVTLLTAIAMLMFVQAPRQTS